MICLCKKEFKNYLKNNEYEYVSSIRFRGCFIVINEKIAHGWHFKEDNADYVCENFADYFYTENEIRQLKLKKLL